MSPQEKLKEKKKKEKYAFKSQGKRLTANPANTPCQ